MSQPDTSAAAGGHKLNPALEVDVLRGHITREYAEEIAALREQLEQAKRENAGIVAGIVKLNDRLNVMFEGARDRCAEALAALKQMREAVRGFIRMDDNPIGSADRSGYFTALKALRDALAIQPDSSALKAVIEAEPEVEALQDGGTCCICDNPITGYDSYGISDKQQHRYHWHCVRREAATVSSPTSEAETAKLREDVERLKLRNEIFESAYNRAYKATYQSHTGHWDRTGQRGANCPECNRATEARKECQDIIANGLRKLSEHAASAQKADQQP